MAAQSIGIEKRIKQDPVFCEEKKLEHKMMCKHCNC